MTIEDALKIVGYRNVHGVYEGELNLDENNHEVQEKMLRAGIVLPVSVGTSIYRLFLCFIEHLTGAAWANKELRKIGFVALFTLLNTDNPNEFVPPDARSLEEGETETQKATEHDPIPQPKAAEEYLDVQGPTTATFRIKATNSPT